MKNRKEVVAATAELREKNKPVPPAPKPTQEELLTEILSELKKQNAVKEETPAIENAEEKVEETVVNEEKLEQK